MKRAVGAGGATLFVLAQLCTIAQAAAANITRYASTDIPLIASPRPLSHASSDGNQIVDLFLQLGRTSTWKYISNITLEGDSHEPEGLVRLGPDRFVISSTQYDPGAGRLIVFSGNGSRLAEVTLSQSGSAEYHNGGIDYDGEFIWATIAQYRPNSSAYVVRVKPETLESETILKYDDHLGGIVHDVQTDRLYTLNWGSRNESIFDLRKRRVPFWWSFGEDRNIFSQFRTPNKVVWNPSYFIDYQDCKFLGHAQAYDNEPIMLCSGVSTLSINGRLGMLGGLALVDVQTMVTLAEIPVTMTTASGALLTQNPMDVSIEDGKLRFCFAPEQGNSTLYIIEAQP
jgi:hypothetical protein